ncbi:UNVERIFIED_CONTAM: hypothetical protein Slati_3796600 [Sesamum latifolium]|uniref:Uncharacterized protein n=1 Tax=Sesamum latifolium TaxID=2727402 RepID=A0AAW2U5F8_9LAMI
MEREREALGRGETRHTLCVRCGCRSFHLQKSRYGACTYPALCMYIEGGGNDELAVAPNLGGGWVPVAAQI